jgi:CBS domain-containing protein
MRRTISIVFHKRILMTTIRILALSIVWALMSTPSVTAQDLSRYRDFRLGTNLVTVARQAGITHEARVLHQRPALIEELMWQPPRPFGTSPQSESVRKVLFSFYNGDLYRIVVDYDRDRTEGMTAEDMVDAVSGKYGLATLPSTQMIQSSTQVIPSSRAFSEDAILAHWEDSDNSVTLSSSHLSTFVLVVVSKRLEALAGAASVEAIRLDKQEAPQRESDRRQNQTVESRAKQETARELNRAAFRP